MSYKTIDGLMRHLRDNGIAISGSSQKRQLRNTGYFHGYKGYRFFKNAQNSLPFVSYNEVYATIQYDSALKALLYGKIYTLKDLRNAIAHNSVVFDTRFRNIDPTSAMKQCLKIEIGLPYVNFKTIGDYVILMCYYMKLLQVPKTEIKAFVREFERITEDYRKAVNANVASIVIHPDLASRMNLLKNFL